MKRTARFVSVLLAAALILGTAILPVAAAAPEETTVWYNGTSREVEFNGFWPFGSNTQPDLFPNMKNMMPGDSATQEITIGARKLGMDRVKIWLRAENPNEDYSKLLSEAGHWVTFTVTQGDNIITGNLAEGVLLGEFSANKKTTVTVELTIDVEADNTLQDLTAEIDWVFSVEIIPGTDGLPQPEVDGDDLPWLTKRHINYLMGYTDGTVRPQAPITRAEAATMFYRLLTDEVRESWQTEKSAFSDVAETDWFFCAVSAMHKGGILKGYPNGTFKPNEPITRAELAAIICRFDTKFGTVKPTASFRDCRWHWASKEIAFAATRGYVVGYPDGKFRPNQNITRAETVTMINRCLQRTVDGKGLRGDYVTWKDNLPGAWYYYEILEAANHHTYACSDRVIEDRSYRQENWVELLPPIDWTEEEKHRAKGN